MDAETFGLIGAGIAGLSGLLGASIGGLVTSSVARSASATRWNTGLFEESRGFYLEVVAAVQAQYITLAAAAKEFEIARDKAVQGAMAAGAQVNDRVDLKFERSAETQKRVFEATRDFRLCLAKRVIYADEGLNSHMESVDAVRQDITSALNAGRMTEAQEGIEAMRALLGPLNRSIQRSIIRHQLVAVNTVHPLRGRRKMRRILVGQLHELNVRDGIKPESHWGGFGEGTDPTIRKRE